MDDPIITQAILTFWGGVLLGLTLGGLTGWLKGFAWGVAVGCLMIGAAGLAGAGWLGWHRYHSLAGTEVAQGVLMEWVTERSTDADNRVSITHAPVVRFNARDGETYRIKGLAGGENDLAPGSAVTVRYRIDDPNQALIADFQNLWGGVWALGLFGAIPGMMGAFFLAMAIGEARESRNAGARMRPARPPSLQRPQLVKKFFIAGGILLVSALFVVPYFGATALEAIGLMFLTIFAGCAALACATILRGDDWDTPAILLLLGVSFGLFGFGAYMLG